MIERILPIEEYHRIAGIFSELQDTPPAPGEGVILIAEEAGEVVGVAVLQRVWHIEPVWVAAPWRGRGVLQRLLKAAWAVLPKRVPGVLCYTKCPRTAKLIKRFGLEHMADWQVFRWVNKGAH